jgi:hypothetical protein
MLDLLPTALAMSDAAAAVWNMKWLGLRVGQIDSRIGCSSGSKPQLHQS